MEMELPKEGKGIQEEWKKAKAKALGEEGNRANVMQECQLQME